MTDRVLQDKLELAELVATISRGVDRSDEQLIASCYTHDSIDYHGAFTGTGAEFAAYICHGSPVSSKARFLHHSLAQSLFTVDGDHAFGETYFNFHMQIEPTTLFQGVGRYVDEFARQDGRWLLKERRVVTEWTGTHQVTTLGPGEQDITGTRDRTDPLYEFGLAPAAEASS
ncbi:MAG: nuclear transport factor 2 family protein [Sciscionella sp.]